MKKHLLTLCFALLTGSLFAAWSGIDTDSTRNAASLPKSDVSAIIDGVANDHIWTVIPAISISRPFVGETPTLYSAYWKGYWTDTAIVILVQVEDNNFWPSWKSGLADWASDKIELYFDARGTEPRGKGASTNGLDGDYQITSNYDTVPAESHAHGGSFAGTYQANTWSYGDHSVLTVEWSVSFSALLDSNVAGGNALDPFVTTQIGFDICVSDLDSGQSTRNRQMWSNTGRNGEDWNIMDSVGILTLDFCLCDEVRSNQKQDLQNDIFYPNPAQNQLYTKINIDRVAIYSILGQLVQEVDKISDKIDISGLQKGMYFINSFRNNDMIGSQMIIKQ